MRGERLTRRGALRLGGGTALAGLTAGLAGCSGLLGGGDGAGDAEFTQWLPAPGEISFEDGEPKEHYRAGFDDLSVRRDSDALPGVENSTLGEVASSTGVDFGDVRTITRSGGPCWIFEGGFDADGVVDELDESEYGEPSDHGEFTLRQQVDEENVGRVVGVTDGTVIRSGSGPIDVVTGWVEAAIDATNGDIDRYAEASEDFGRLVDELGEGAMTIARTHPRIEKTRGRGAPTWFFVSFENQVATGSSTRVDGDAAEQTLVKVFASADAVPSDQLDAWVEEYENDDESLLARFTEFSVSESGRVWSVSGEVDPSRLPG